MKSIKYILSAISFALISTFAFSQSMILDYAGILSSEQKNELEAVASAFKIKNNFSVYIGTVKSLSGKYVEDASEAFYEENSLGEGEDHEGLMLFMSMEDRDYDIIARGSRGHYSFTDYGKNELANYFKPAFRQNDWCSGFKAFYQGAEALLEKADAGEPVDISNGKSDPRNKPWVVGEIVIFLISLIISSIIVAVLGAGMKNVAIATDANTYVGKDDVIFTSRDSRFLRESRSVTKISSSSSSGGGGTSINSRGYSHSSGKF